MTVTSILQACAPHPNEVISLDHLVERCGYFSFDHSNGYGCKHPEQQDVDENGRGSCYAHSCPVACRLYANEPLDLQELAKRDIDNLDLEGENWMLIHDENLLKAVRT